MRIAILLLAGMIAGCASTPDHYTRYLEAMTSERGPDWSAMAAACTDARCVESVSRDAALAGIIGGGSRNIAPPQRPRDLIDFAQALTPFAGFAVQWRQSDNSRDMSIATTEAMWGGLGAIVGSLSDREPGTAITVHGNYGDTRGDVWSAGNNLGDTRGDTVGGDWTGRDRAGRDQIGGNQDRSRVGIDINNRNGRWNSPGPYDDSTGDCRDGGDCSIINPPPIEPPEPVDPGPDPLNPVGPIRCTGFAPQLPGCIP